MLRATPATVPRTGQPGGPRAWAGTGAPRTDTGESAEVTETSDLRLITGCSVIAHLGFMSRFVPEGWPIGSAISPGRGSRMVHRGGALVSVVFVRLAS